MNFWCPFLSPPCCAPGAMFRVLGFKHRIFSPYKFSYYYKMREKNIITECAGITKCDKKLLEIVVIIRKYEIHYKVRRNTLL